MNRLLNHLAFSVGLGVIAWMAAAYIPGNPLALLLVLLIGAFFLMGALELRRFQQATAGLEQAQQEPEGSPPALADWLAQVPASLRQPVRLRVEGERVALPGPALTPYLAGLLVLLGMLGTFLGMVVTLRSTGLALENATDVEAIRASLAAPVKGLGLAFGTSVAGVAASAMLGLMSALARRERQGVAQQLEAFISRRLHRYSRAHQREESLRLLTLQAEVMPALATQMQTLAAQLAQQGQALNQNLLESQTQFHREARQAYSGLAESVDQSLRTSLTDSARLAGEALEPAVQRTLTGLSQQCLQLQSTLSAAVQQQLAGVSQRLDTTAAAMLQSWRSAVAEQRSHNQALTQDLRTGLDHFAQTFEQRSTQLLDSVATRMDESASLWAQHGSQALAQQTQAHRLLAEQGHQAVANTVAGFERQAAALLHSVAQAHTALDERTATRERERLALFHDGLTEVAGTLQRDQQHNGQLMAERQQQICATLERTAQAITEQAQTQARATLAEIHHLLEAAAAAPRAAAEVIGELRSALSDSLVRDNAALDERNRLLATLGGLLDAVNHASTEQRSAIDALVRTSTELLGRASERFAGTVDAESRNLQAVAAQLAGGAAEVASLGEGFGLAVQLFSRASEQLLTQLQSVETALSQAMARSDEQMAYYVAQARDIIDLSLGSHKQVIDGLQQLSNGPAKQTAATAAWVPVA